MKSKTINYFDWFDIQKELSGAIKAITRKQFEEYIKSKGESW